MTAGNKTGGQPDGDWAQLAGRELPTWYDDVKLGVFVHWGPYSVPRWAPRVPDIQELLREGGPRRMLRENPYSEWYLNTMTIRGSPTREHHARTYGPDYSYHRFSEEFTRQADTANVDLIAELAAASGAGYVVLTTKHHDGYTLWPSAHPHPVLGRYGAQRDLVGALGAAARARGMRTGLYYSGGYDWPFNNATLTGPADMLLAIPDDPAYAAYAENHVRELIERYQPSVLWNDIGWPASTDLAALFASYYAAVPEGVVNDRWAQTDLQRGGAAEAALRGLGGLAQLAWKLLPAGSRELTFPASPHHDFTTPEYARYEEVVDKKWETTRGVGHSFAANRNEDPADIVAAHELVHMLIDVVSKNGNLLIGVGPLPDGSVPPEQQEPLRALGRWLHENGSAIRGSRPWEMPSGTAGDGTAVRFTRTGADVNVITLGTPTTSELVLPGLTAGPGVTALLVSGGHSLQIDDHGDGVRVQLPGRLPVSPAHVVRLSGDVRRAGQ
ncbi:alpha-L-fucosidase [Rhodococcus sp. IEGM 1408]|uniref:alpha-L-fucosidase n=1 Tax=Rhodococcus sp. IEGM 1408 TaxID=3082220 RepID=UPI002953F717|nr:alpha-L-fucosidase [Rhodococcus sp. IEGM 1408]MDV8003022.1 alpha-L-fucosidase [Rhodococcus sp. IEGM 1408]